MEDYYRYKKYKLKYLKLKSNLLGGFIIRKISFNPNLYGAIIGREGKQIKKIQKLSNSKISLDKKGEITISYDKEEDLKNAVDLIKKIDNKAKLIPYQMQSNQSRSYGRSYSIGDGSGAVRSYSRGDGSGAVRSYSRGDGSGAVRSYSRGDGSGAVRSYSRGDGSGGVRSYSRGAVRSYSRGDGSSRGSGKNSSIRYPETLNGYQKAKLNAFFGEIKEETGCTSKLDGYTEENKGFIVISGSLACNLEEATSRITEKIQEIMNQPVTRVERIYPSDHPIITSMFMVNDKYLSVWSWNCNLQGNQNMSQIILNRFIEAVQNTIMSIITNKLPDIILLQEYNVRGKTDEYLQMFDDNNYFVLTSKLWGVFTLVKKNIQLVKRSETPLENNLFLIMDDALEATSYNVSTPLLKSCSPIIMSEEEEEKHIRGEEYLHHPPMVYYKQGDRYRVGKNTSLDIVVKIGDMNIRVRNIHLAVKSITGWNQLYPNFLEVLPDELLLLGGDFNAKNEKTSTRGLNLISREWEPVVKVPSSLEGFSSLGIWNDGFVFSNRLVSSNFNYYLRDFNYRKQEDKIEGVDEDTLISDDYKATGFLSTREEEE